MFRRLLSGFVILLCAACTSETTSNAVPSKNIDILKNEFMASCDARPEYQSRKRAGTLDRLCTCIFNKTMKGLSEEERVTAAFYLYGETHDDFRERLKATPFNPDTMMAAAEAVGKAAKTCR